MKSKTQSQSHYLPSRKRREKGLCKFTSDTWRKPSRCLLWFNKKPLNMCRLGNHHKGSLSFDVRHRVLPLVSRPQSFFFPIIELRAKKCCTLLRKPQLKNDNGSSLSWVLNGLWMSKTHSASSKYIPWAVLDFGTGEIKSEKKEMFDCFQLKLIFSIQLVLIRRNAFGDNLVPR